MQNDEKLNIFRILPSADDMLTDIKRKFIGQEKTIDYLFYNILNNLDASTEERSIIFLDGPSGTGKKAITKDIIEKLNIPFSMTSIIKYLTKGYVGNNLSDILKELYINANGDLEKAQRGIIVLYDFDNIAYSYIGILENKKVLQHQLINLMSGKKYPVDVGNNFYGSQYIEFDTSNLTFVYLTTLSSLRNEKTKPQIGFSFDIGTKDLDYTITPQDLISLGFESDLVGMLNTFLHTDEYSKDELLNILKQSTISPLLSFEKFVMSKGKILNMDAGVCDVIVDAAYNLDTGARSLQTIMNTIRTYCLKDVMCGKSKEIKLDEELVKEIIKGTFNRRGRI